MGQSYDADMEIILRVKMISSEKEMQMNVQDLGFRSEYISIPTRQVTHRREAKRNTSLD